MSSLFNPTELYLYDRSITCHNTRNDMSELTSMSRHFNDNIPRKRLQPEVVFILSHVRNKGVFNKTSCSVLSHARIDPIRTLSQQKRTARGLTRVVNANQPWITPNWLNRSMGRYGFSVISRWHHNIFQYLKMFASMIVLYLSAGIVSWKQYKYNLDYKLALVQINRALNYTWLYIFS